MSRLTSTHRIVLGLVSLVVSVLLTAGMIGLIPNSELQDRQARAAFSEMTAVSFMALAPRMDTAELCETLEAMGKRNPDVLSMAVRKASGEVALEFGPHATTWQSVDGNTFANENIVPITSGGDSWGQLEVRWATSNAFTVFGYKIRSDIALTIFVSVSLFFGFSYFLKRVLRQVNPSKVVPNRVRDALNALSEGLLVLDCNNLIVLANESFATATGRPADTMIGSTPKQFAFRVVDSNGEATAKKLPWEVSTRNETPQKGVLLAHGEGDDRRTYAVSTVPVKSENNVIRGLVASFEDVTLLQQKQEELRFALTSLRTSSDEVRKQNHELEWLATRDTLTGCMNRRCFFHEFENHWQESESNQLPMAGVMVDIDFFKAVNDNHGHGMGDEVLRQVSAALMKTLEQTDFVCRYGGEEFSVLMPNTSIDEAELKAEQCRLAIKALRFEKLTVTASLGVSAMCQNAESPQDLLDQADKCLYAAKRNGRNQVVRWDRAQDQIAKMRNEVAPTREQEMTNKAASAIPYHAVAALTSALAHRDQATAIHSRRVADMCVAAAEGLLGLRECYVLEIAALLHDIGKIGIPDSILRKPGRLSPEELELVLTYNHLGVEMVRGSFGAPVLTEIVEQHVVFYDMSNSERGAGPNQRPSVGARILAIANAYDTMVSKLSHRSTMSRSEAFAELRRCAGTQFDPELVERFIVAVRLRLNQAEAGKIKITRESALNIGLMLEQLIAALEDQDVTQLLDITDSLQITATTHGLLEIAQNARLLHQTLEEGCDEIEVMQLAGELLDLCRVTQASLIAEPQLVR